MNLNSFYFKIKDNRKIIFRTLAYFVVFRSVYGFSVLAIAYFLGVTVDDLRNWEYFGFRIYFLIIAIIIFLMFRRYRKVYKWWKNLPNPGDENHQI